MEPTVGLRGSRMDRLPARGVGPQPVEDGVRAAPGKPLEAPDPELSRMPLLRWKLGELGLSL
jgi:hypothetical protein